MVESARENALHPLHAGGIVGTGITADVLELQTSSWLRRTK
jgi:hypothetical protein